MVIERLNRELKHEPDRARPDDDAASR